MNGGAYGRETKDALIEARGVDRAGNVRVFSNADMHYTYRHCGAPDDVIFTQALFQGAPGDPAAIAAEMDKITESREATQPIKSRTGGSTFKNPPGHKAWQLIDAAGCRGLESRRRAGLGDALQFSDQPRQRHRRRHRDAGRDRAPAREGEFRRRARMGDQADRSSASIRLSDGSSSLVTFMSLLGSHGAIVRATSAPRRRGTPASQTLDATVALGSSGRQEHQRYG